MIGQPKAGFVPGHVGSLGLGYSRDSLRWYVKARLDEMDGVADGPRKRGEVASTGDEAGGEAGTRTLRFNFLKLVMARDFWSKSLPVHRLHIYRHSSLVHKNRPERTLFVETSWRRLLVQKTVGADSSGETWDERHSAYGLAGIPR